MPSIDMDAVTRGLVTKSAKIRALEEHGVPRADIARYLQIRYQHVRNVLVSPKPRRRAESPKAELTNASSAAGLTIEEAKHGLAMHFGVPKEAIEIVIRG